MRLAVSCICCCTLSLAPPAWTQTSQAHPPPLDSGLVVWFPFDGDLRDSSGNGHRAVPAVYRFVSDRFGGPNSAIRLTDTAVHIMLIPPSSDFDLSDDQAVSLGYWFRLQQTRSHEAVSVHAGGNSALCRFLTIGIRTSGTLVSTSVHASECRITMEHRLEGPPEAWHHVLCTVNDEFFTLFLDGREVARRAVYDMKWFVPNPQPIRVSRSGPGQERMWFELDDLRMYRRVLPETEISRLFEEGGHIIGAAQGMGGSQK